MDYTPDTDPVETQEWLNSLEGVIEVEGPERAHYLLNRVMDGARQKGAPVPYSANTPYLNTIPVDKRRCIRATAPSSSASARSSAGTRSR